MDRVSILVLLSCVFELTFASCGDEDGDDKKIESCAQTVNTIVGIVIGIVIILAIIIGSCVGVCAMLGYSFGCLKATEAPRRVGPAYISDQTGSHTQPPPYNQVTRNYGTNNQNGRPSTPPPSYSSLDQPHPIQGQSIVHTIGTNTKPSNSQLIKTVYRS